MEVPMSMRSPIQQPRYRVMGRPPLSLTLSHQRLGRPM
jgi:hypothetical protein